MNERRSIALPSLVAVVMAEKTHSFTPVALLIPALCLVIYVAGYFSLGRFETMRGGTEFFRVFHYQWQKDAFWVAGRTESFIRQSPVVVYCEADVRRLQR
jgi:hypothetical protein